jgi:hypothetical protein
MRCTKIISNKKKKNLQFANRNQQTIKLFLQFYTLHPTNNKTIFFFSLSLLFFFPIPFDFFPSPLFPHRTRPLPTQFLSFSFLLFPHTAHVHHFFPPFSPVTFLFFFFFFFFFFQPHSLFSLAFIFLFILSFT